jgi:sodium-dependent phosphate cotransporter
LKNERYYLISCILPWSATQFTNLLTGIGAVELFSPLDYIVEPIANFIVGLTQEKGWIVLIIAFALLYFSLRGLVKSLKAILDEDLQEKVKKYLFGSWWKALLFGLVITIAVQSSSITTSVIVPIIALGVVAAIQALPYFLGANIGTSTTALLAALSLASNGNAEGTASLMVALVHMFFDIYAIILLFPIRKIREIPVWLAQRSGEFITKGRIVAIGYIAIIFYALPFAGVWLTRGWDVATFYKPIVPQEVETLRQEASTEGATGV